MARSDKNQDKIPHVGRQSGKSSDRWFRNSNMGSGLHPKGNGASAGDGKTSDESVLGKIVPKFLRGDS